MDTYYLDTMIRIRAAELHRRLAEQSGSPDGFARVSRALDAVRAHVRVALARAIIAVRRERPVRGVVR